MTAHASGRRGGDRTTKDRTLPLAVAGSRLYARRGGIVTGRNPNEVDVREGHIDDALATKRVEANETARDEDVRVDKRGLGILKASRRRNVDYDVEVHVV